jgi:hypothetical protein
MKPSDPDEPWIAIAMLHGCSLAHNGVSRWYVISPTSEPHPVEQVHYETTGVYGFRSRGELARAYCKHYGLTP